MDTSKKLEDIFKYHTSDKENGFTYGWEQLYNKYKEYRFKSLSPHFNGRSVLEIGPAEGDMTIKLLECFKEVAVIEGSEGFAGNLQNTLKGGRLTIYTGLVEEVCINRKFDTIILSHVLEHLDQPVSVLKKVKDMLEPEGVLLVMVPNANSLHRHVGVMLGMIKELYSINETDRKIGHKRVYDFSSLERDVCAAGFDVKQRGGVLIKLLSNLQMVEVFSEDQLNAFFKLGNIFPDIACEIFIACKKKC